MWTIEPRDGYTEAGLGLWDISRNTSLFVRSPARIIAEISRCLILERCPEDPQAPLELADRFCTYTGPISPVAREDPGVGNCSVPVIVVVAVDGADNFRLFTLSDGICEVTDDWSPIVVPRRACLKCSLEMYRRVGAKTLIL